MRAARSYPGHCHCHRADGGDEDGGDEDDGDGGDNGVGGDDHGRWWGLRC